MLKLIIHHILEKRAAHFWPSLIGKDVLLALLLIPGGTQQSGCLEALSSALLSCWRWVSRYANPRGDAPPASQPGQRSEYPDLIKRIAPVLN